MSAEIVVMPAPAEDAAAALPAIKAQLATIEEQLRRSAEGFRREEATKDAALAQYQAETAPRQIEALQPGLVIEAASLAAGSLVQPTTILGQLTTRQGWEVECQLSISDWARLRPGQEISVVTVSPDGNSIRVQEQLTTENRARRQPKFALLSSRDEWREGTPVRIEMMVVTGTLLDAWLEELRRESAW
jgi:multidrug resistance efflux pump